MSRLGTKDSEAIKTDPLAALLYLYAFFWLGVYTIAAANNVNTGGLGSAALGEILLLIAGLPIVLMTLTQTLKLFNVLAGFVSAFGLVIDQIIFNAPLVSAPLLQALGSFAAAGNTNLIYVTTAPALVLTLGAFGIAEEGGFGILSRSILDYVFKVSPNQLLKGAAVSAINGVIFAFYHTFVTVLAYSQLLGVPPLFGQFNFAFLLTPFALSAIFARIILDTAIRATKSHLAGMVGHASLDMGVTAKAVGLF